MRLSVVEAPGIGLAPILTALVDPERRHASARELAARFGAEDLVLFVRDGELGVFLPALGFPQTLPDGARWQRFLAESRQAGSLAGELRSPHHQGRVVPALALVAGDGSVVVFLGGSPHADGGELQGLLPLVSTALYAERVAFAAEARAVVERQSGRQLGALAESFDRLRLDLQRALVEAGRARAEMERAIQSRDQVLAVVSHDVRGPLGTILLTANTLRKIAPGSQLDARVDTIERAAGRIHRLVRDLLDFGSIEKGQLGVELGRHDPAEIVRDAISSLQLCAEQKGLALHGSVEGYLSPLTCDRDRILQVLSNIISNAISVTRAGGSIRLRVAPLGRDLLFTVADTGPGIEAEDLEHLFERHWRGHRASYRGTGLGLAIAKGIVVAHDGRIWAESRVGVGSSFFFTLPLEPNVSEPGNARA